MWSAPRLYHDSDSTVTGSSERDTFEYNSAVPNELQLRSRLIVSSAP
jgi:hypothetical protein